MTSVQHSLSAPHFDRNEMTFRKRLDKLLTLNTRVPFGLAQFFTAYLQTPAKQNRQSALGGERARVLNTLEGNSAHRK